MRICFFIASLDGGGAQRQCIALLNALQHVPSVEAHLILLGPGVFDDRLDTSELVVHRTDVGNFANPRALAVVVRTLRRVRPDVLMSWLHPADIWSYAATRLVPGVPWVMTERGSVYPDQLAFNIRKLVGRRADAIIANSAQGSQLWERLAPRSPVQWIPNMVIDADIRPQATADRADSVECLAVGRLEPEKNIGEMVAAFSWFATTQHRARLSIAGKGVLAGEAGEIAAAAGVRDRLELLGFRKDVPDLMARARIFLSFSRYEGMPNVVMEAVSAGLPAVVSDIPEHRALLGDDYPYYVPLGAPAADGAAVIARAWTEGLGTSDGVYSHARGVLQTMTPDNVVTAYLDAFTDVITRERVSPDANRLVP
jgi:glycosyltransferase involved in cell wall biosynthesis